MAKRLMLVDAAHPEETRVVVLNGNRLEEFDFETSTKKQIKGNIYLARVTRVEPSLQAAFVEYGGNRHGFLAFSEIHPDYYRIPVADRQAALAAERAAEQAAAAREDAERDREDAERDREDAARERDEARHEREELRHEREDAFEQALHPGDAVPDEPDDEAEDDKGSADRMAHAARSDTIREGAVDQREPDAAAFAHDDAPAPDATAAPDRAASSNPSSTVEDPHDTPAAADPYEAAEQGFAAAGDISGRVGETTHDDAADEAHGDTIETLGGDEIEEARPRARSLRHYKIQEVIKRRQIMLVQVTKEERGNKGAALTTYLSLAGRYCVLMPNTPRGGGVSRKITSATDRRRLKDLMSDLSVPEGMGVIVRTAGSERSKAEIKRDFEYLMRLWDEIRALTLQSTAPALIYEEGNLIKRSIRDLYTRDIEEVLVDGDEGYRTAKTFMKMLMPSHAKRVKLYRDPTVPLFHRHQVESQIDAIHSPIVQLRSGGYIVINPTEALVAIDVNSGRSTRERNIEETALKTNLEAADEVARQLRLRDLAGLIVIDFIDMEEYRNRGAVERRMRDAMRHDRARIQLGRISPFGLLELSRQRLRPSLLEASTQPCPHCGGTGHIRSIESTALHVLRAIEEEGTRRRSAEISVAVPSRVALYVLNQKRAAVQQAEQRFGFRVTITSDDTLIPPDFRLDRLRALTPAEIAALPSFTPPPPEPEEEEEEEEEEIAIDEEEVVAIAAEPPPQQTEEEAEPQAEDEGGPARRRRRRGRRTRHGEEGREPRHGEERRERGARAPQPMERQAISAPAEETLEAEPAPHRPEAAPEPGGDDGKRRRRGRRGGRRRRRGAQPGEAAPYVAGPEAETVEFVPPESPSSDEPLHAIEEAFAGGTVAPEPQFEVASVPVADGNAPPAPRPAPPSEAAPVPAAATPASTQYDAPPHEINGPAPNPRRGWWRR